MDESSHRGFAGPILILSLEGKLGKMLKGFRQIEDSWSHGLNPRHALLLILLPSLSLLPSLTRPSSAQSALLNERTWGGRNKDTGNAIAVDSSGDAYVAGDTYSFGPGSSYLRSSLSLLKYDSSGSLLWQDIWLGSGNASDSGSGIAVDASGHVYVTGYTDSFGAGMGEVLILKFDHNGTLPWQRIWGGSGIDVGASVAADASGNIYVAGFTNSFGAGGNDVLLLKLDSSGGLVWQRTWGGSGIDVGTSVAVDDLGNVYVTCYTNSFGAGSNDVLLLKVDPSGNLVWQRTWGGANGDAGFGVAVDSSDHIYVAGNTGSFGAGNDDVLILKFDSTGALLWQRTWGGSGRDGGSHVAVDALGNPYVTGTTGSFGGLQDVLLLKFDPAGSLSWQRTWHGGSPDLDAGSDVAVDTSGNAWVTGYVNEAPPYTLSSPTGIIATPTFSPSTPSGSFGTPSYTLHTPAGTTQTPTGSETYAGNADQFLLKYGPLPAITFQTITLQTTPPGVGSITFNGTIYQNGQTSNYPLGITQVRANPSSGYAFVNWSTSGGITVADSTSNPTMASITGPGILTAVFAVSQGIIFGVPFLTFFGVTGGLVILGAFTIFILGRRRSKNRISAGTY